MKHTHKKREEFQNYLQLHDMSQGQFLWEVVSAPIAQAFPAIQDSQGVPLPNDPLPLSGYSGTHYAGSSKTFSGV